MEPLLFGGIAVAVVAGIAGFVWWFSDDQVARRKMRAIPRRRIADVEEGERVRVVGVAEVPRALEAPLSGRACAAWRVVVQELRSAGRSRHWKTIIDEHEAVEFILTDGDDRARVEAVHVHPLLEQDGRYQSGMFNDASVELEGFLMERGHSSEGILFNKGMRYREGVLEAGETVAVVGVGRWERDPDAKPTAGDGYREARTPQRLVLSCPDDGPLLLSDEPDQVS